MSKQLTQHCKNGLFLVKPELSTRASIKHIKCASCGTTCRSTESDGWDEYAIKLGISRPMAILLLVKFDRALDQGLQRLVVPRNQPTQCGSIPSNAPKFTRQTYANIPNAELAELNFQTLPANLTHGTCLVDAHCTACGSSFQFTVSDQPRTNHKPLSYCPYCATQTLVITPNNSTLSYIERTTQQWEHLASVYSPKPSTQAEQIVWLADIQAKYHFWENHSTVPTFAQFMHDLPNLMANELQTQANPLNTTKQITSNNRPVPNKNKQTRRLVIKVKHSTLPNPASQTNPQPEPDPDKLYTGSNAATPTRVATMVYPRCMLCQCEQPSKTLKPLCEPCNLIADKRRINLQQNTTRGSC